MVQGWAYDTNEFHLEDMLGLLGLPMSRSKRRADDDLALPLRGKMLSQNKACTGFILLPPWPLPVTRLQSFDLIISNSGFYTPNCPLPPSRCPSPKQPS